MESKRGKRNIIAKAPLLGELELLVGEFDPYNSLILRKLFSSYYDNFVQIINEIQKSNRSDIVFSYGNNNYVSKILINDIIQIKKKEENIKVTVLNFNSYIHSSEEVVIKEICKELGIETERSGFDGSRVAIEDYYKKMEYLRKQNHFNQDNSLIVIFFENIEYLLEKKKKQTLFYTLIEIVNMSSNIFICGLTSNHDLMNNMEKRVKSRFSHRTIFIKNPDSQLILGALEDSVNCISKKYTPEAKSSLQIFYETLLTTNQLDFDYNFFVIIEKYVYLGLSIKEIITKIKYILVLVMMKIRENPDRDVFEFADNIRPAMETVFTIYINEEANGSFFNLIKNFPKLHVLLLACLWRCVGKYKTKITIGMIYQEYTDFCINKNSKVNMGMNKFKLDLMVVKKALEELINSNLVTVKNDDKYVQVYELKLPSNMIQKIIQKLFEMNCRNFDSEMNQYINVDFK